jgi:hypothetical protein
VSEPAALCTVSSFYIITGKRLGKNAFSETTDTIQKYSDVFDGLMQNFRDQVTRDVAIHIHDMGAHVHDISTHVQDISIHVHRTGKSWDVLVT